MSDPLLRALVDLRDRQIQKARIQFGNRLAAIENATDDPSDSIQASVIDKWLIIFTDLEGQLDKDITKLVKDIPIYEEMSNVKGIGPMLAAKIIAMVDIERAQTISALWRYCGYGVKDGERERPIKGEKLHYNKRLKTSLYLVATSFLRCNSPYREFYDRARVRYDETRPDWTDGHKHNAAMRKMTKMFLSHLWQRWRILEGLPIRTPYSSEYLDHSTVYEPKDYGWDGGDI
jgi:ribosomal protein S13